MEDVYVELLTGAIQNVYICLIPALAKNAPKEMTLLDCYLKVLYSEYLTQY